MKKFKHILAAVLAVLLLLTACGTVPPDPTNTEQTKATEATEYIPPFATRPVETLPDPATTDMKINCQYLPATMENPDNLPVLKWVCLMDYSDGMVWSEAAAIEVNQMLADRNMPFRVQFVIYTTDFFYHNMDWFVRPEAQADIAAADLLYNCYMKPEQAAGYYMPITEYVKGDATPSLKNAVPHEINWQKSSVNGQIYGISKSLCNAYGSGWIVDTDVLAEYGMTVSDFQKDYWEMDETLKKLNEASGKRNLIKMSLDTTSGFISIDKNEQFECIYPGIVGEPMRAYFTEIGSVFAVEYVNNVPTVVNMLDTEMSVKIRDAVLRYRDQYGASDNGKVNIKLYYSSMDGHASAQKILADNGEEQWEIPVSSSYYNASERTVLQYCSGVSASSKYQKEAVTLLSLIAEDEEFRMQLLYGKEGRDYTFNENGEYKKVKQEDGSTYNMSFLSPWSYFSGLNDALPQYEGMTVLETYLEMIENAEPYYAVPFDLSGLQDELIAVAQVCQLYFYRFASLTDEKYAEMLQKITDAGGDKIQAELQKQLDEWVKANPDKVAANRQ